MSDIAQSGSFLSAALLTRWNSDPCWLLRGVIERGDTISSLFDRIFDHARRLRYVTPNVLHEGNSSPADDFSSRDIPSSSTSIAVANESRDIHDRLERIRKGIRLSDESILIESCIFHPTSRRTPQGILVTSCSLLHSLLHWKVFDEDHSPVGYSLLERVCGSLHFVLSVRSCRISFMTRSHERLCARRVHMEHICLISSDISCLEFFYC